MDKVRDVLSSLGRHKTINKKGPKRKPKHVVFEYTGDGCSVPKDVISVRFNDGLQMIGSRTFINCTY